MSKSRNKGKEESKNPENKQSETRAYRAFIKNDKMYEHKEPHIDDKKSEKSKESEKSTHEEASDAGGTTRFDTSRVPSDASKELSSSTGSKAPDFAYRDPEEWESNLLSLNDPRIIRSPKMKVKSGEPLKSKPHVKELEALMHQDINKNRKEFNDLKNDILTIFRDYLSLREATDIGGDIIWTMREIENLNVDGSDDDTRIKLVQLSGKLAIIKDHVPEKEKKGRWFHSMKKENNLKATMDKIEKKLNASRIYQRFVVKSMKSAGQKGKREDDDRVKR